MLIHGQKTSSAQAKKTPVKTGKSVKIERITVPKPHDILADHLRDSILKGDVPEGESLPSERELVEQTGLSRGAVREALRTLAVEGLIETRHGRFGGNFVTLPGHDYMANAIDRFVQSRRIPLRSLQETREVLEPFLARLAANHRSDEQMAEIKSLHQHLVNSSDNFQEFARTNIRWHNAIARASGNELLMTFLFSLSHGMQVATMVEEYDTPETRRQVIAIHSRITDAIEARDAELAERSMRHHMTATQVRSVSMAGREIPLAGK